MRPHAAARCLSILALCAVGGCALGQNDVATSKNILPNTGGPPDSVTVEIVFLHVAPEETERLASLWREIDEQVLPAESRRRLAANGMRCGVIGSLMPSDLRFLLDHGPGSITNEGSSVAEAIAAAPPARAIHLRPGKRGEIVAGGEREQIELLYVDNDGHLQGETLRRAQTLFASIAAPLADGRVSLELTPEVHYGAPRQRYVGQGAAFRIDSFRDRRIFDELSISLMLSPGETLVVGCSADSKGLGRLFFTGGAAAANEQRLLLIRLVQSQHDDRFDIFEPDSIVSNSSR